MVHLSMREGNASVCREDVSPFGRRRNGGGDSVLKIAGAFDGCAERGQRFGPGGMGRPVAAAKDDPSSTLYPGRLACLGRALRNSSVVMAVRLAMTPNSFSTALANSYQLAEPELVT